METIITQHLVRNEDLNHHGSLFAGRSAEWMTEAAFMTAASLLSAESIVAVKINELCYLAPVYPGDVLEIEGKAVYAGKSSVVIYVSAEVKGSKVIEGFSTFVHIDENGRSIPHGITIEAATEEEIDLMERAKKTM